MTSARPPLVSLTKVLIFFGCVSITYFHHLLLNLLVGLHTRQFYLRAPHQYRLSALNMPFTPHVDHKLWFEPPVTQPKQLQQSRGAISRHNIPTEFLVYVPKSTVYFDASHPTHSNSHNNDRAQSEKVKNDPASLPRLSQANNKRA